MLTEIERAQQREKSAALDHCEGIVARTLIGKFPTARGLTDDERERAEIFVRWCDAAGVRYCPAKPATIAAFILGQKSRGVSPETVLDQVLAIETLHDYHGLANPVATFPARSALTQIATLGASAPPRGWSENERILFPLLPIEIRAVIGRRDGEREKALSRAMNEADRARRQLAAAENAATSKEEINDHSQTQ